MVRPLEVLCALPVATPGPFFLFLAGRPLIPSQGSFILSQGCVVRNTSNDDSNAQWGEG